MDWNIPVKKPGKNALIAVISSPTMTTATIIAPMVLVARSPRQSQAAQLTQDTKKQ